MSSSIGTSTGIALSRTGIGNLRVWVLTSFGRGASKSTTQGGIFDLNMYITFDCAEIAAF